MTLGYKVLGDGKFELEATSGLTHNGDAIYIPRVGGTVTVDSVVAGVSGTVAVSALPGVAGTVGIQGYRSSDSTFQPARLDKATNTLQTIDYSHHEIHAGSMYTCSYSNTAPTNTNEQTIIAFWTPAAAPYMHIFWHASSTAGGVFNIYEDSGLIADVGSTATVWNHDRNSDNTSGVRTVTGGSAAGSVSTFNVSQSAAGTLVTTTPIYTYYLGAAAAGADTSGEIRSESEFILKANTQYAFVVKSLSDDTSTHSITLNWYEHTNIA